MSNPCSEFQYLPRHNLETREMVNVRPYNFRLPSPPSDNVNDTEETRNYVNIPWTPPPPFEAPSSEEQSSNQNENRSLRSNINYIVDIMLAHNLGFMIVTILCICFAIWFLYEIIMEGVGHQLELLESHLQSQLESHFRSIVNTTRFKRH